MRPLSRLLSLALDELTTAELDAVTAELQQYQKAVEDDPASRNSVLRVQIYTPKARRKLDKIYQGINRVLIQKKKLNGTYNKEASTAGYSGRKSNKR